MGYEKLEANALAFIGYRILIFMNIARKMLAKVPRDSPLPAEIN